jgi:hypothetical protein
MTASICDFETPADQDEVPEVSAADLNLMSQPDSEIDRLA